MLIHCLNLSIVRKLMIVRSLNQMSVSLVRLAYFVNDNNTHRRIKQLDGRCETRRPYIERDKSYCSIREIIFVK